MRSDLPQCSSRNFLVLTGSMRLSRVPAYVESSSSRSKMLMEISSDKNRTRRKAASGPRSFQDHHGRDAVGLGEAQKTIADPRQAIHQARSLDVQRHAAAPSLLLGTGESLGGALGEPLLPFHLRQASAGLQEQLKGAHVTMAERMVAAESRQIGGVERGPRFLSDLGVVEAPLEA